MKEIAWLDEYIEHRSDLVIQMSRDYGYERDQSFDWQGAVRCFEKLVAAQCGSLCVGGHRS
jgi:hypothetical protein